MAYTQKERSQDDWTYIHVRVEAKDYIKETEKAYCFKLWGKKFLAFPKSLARDLRLVEKEYTFTVVKWFLKEHSLRSIIEDFDKHHLPTKKELAAQNQNKIDFDSIAQSELYLTQKPERTEPSKKIDLDPYAPVEW